MSDIMNAGGSLSMLVLGLGVIAMVMILGGAGLAAAKRRVPLFYWVCGPLLVAGVSALGAWFAAGGYMSEIGGASAETIVEVASRGLFDSLAIEWFGRWVAAFLFAAASWAAAVGSFMAGPEGKYTPVASGLTAAISVLASLIILAYAQFYGIEGGQPLVLAGLTLFGGFGVAFAALKRALYEHAERVASMRFVSGICLILAVSYGGRAMTMGTRMDAFGPEGIASKAANLAQAVMMWQDISDPVWTLSWIAFGFALAIGFTGFYYELGEVVDRFTLLDVWAALLVFGVVGASRFLENWRIDSLQDVAKNDAAALMFVEVGSDLTPALLQLGDVTLNVEPDVGGFGDVLQYKDEKWVRRYAWDGAGWWADETPVDEATLSPLRPLLVMNMGDDAAPLVQMLEKVGGKALFLLKGEEVKADIAVPDELTYLRVAFVPMELATDMDLKTELWARGGFREVNWGPTAWYGDSEAENAVQYLDDVFNDTKATGLQILLGEKGRVKDAVSGCLAATMVVGEDGKTVSKGTAWCRISLGIEEEVRASAMELWEVPNPEHTKMSFGEPTAAIAGLVGADKMKDRLIRELGAIDYCIEEAREEGELVDGRMQLLVEFDKKGAISTTLDEKSKNTNYMVERCVNERFKKVKFVFDEASWPADPEPTEEQKAKGEEPEPLPPETLTVFVDVTSPAK
jgi:hypothetical protein